MAGPFYTIRGGASFNSKEPGGDLAAGEPWRMAVSFLYKVYGNGFTTLKLDFLKNLEAEKTSLIIRMIDRGINCPLTCGAGRMFGGGGDSVFKTRRGVEKVMFQITIVVIVLFVSISVVSVLLQA